MNYIIAIGIFQSFLALLLLKISGQRRPVHHLLRWLLACICIHLTMKFVIYAGPENMVIQQGFNTFIDLAYGPLLWIVARKVQDDRYVPIRNWYFFLPALIAAFAYIAIAIHLFATGNEPVKEITVYNTVTKYFICISLIIFPVLAYRISKNLSPFWATEKKLLRNLTILFMLMGLVITTGLLSDFFIEFTDSISLWFRAVVYSILTIESILIIRYLFQLQAVLKSTETEKNEPIQSKAIVQTDLPVVIDMNELTFEKGLQQVTGKEELLQEIDKQSEVMQQLGKLMTEKKVYKDSELSLDKLANLSKIPRHHITESLHRHAGTSFYQFVNGYRIQEVTTIMDKCKEQGISPNILSLAFEAGFHSKSTFNQYFKKITGLTPSEYLKKQNTKPVKTATKTTVFLDLMPSGKTG